MDTASSLTAIPYNPPPELFPPSLALPAPIDSSSNPREQGSVNRLPPLPVDPLSPTSTSSQLSSPGAPPRQRRTSNGGVMAKIRQLEEQAKVAAASPPASPPRRRRTISSASRSGKQWANRLEVEAGSTDKGKSPEVAGQAPANRLRSPSAAASNALPAYPFPILDRNSWLSHSSASSSQPSSSNSPLDSTFSSRIATPNLRSPAPASRPTSPAPLQPPRALSSAALAAVADTPPRPQPPPIPRKSTARPSRGESSSRSRESDGRRSRASSVERVRSRASSFAGKMRDRAASFLHRDGAEAGEAELPLEKKEQVIRKVPSVVLSPSSSPAPIAHLPPVLPPLSISHEALTHPRPRPPLHGPANSTPSRTPALSVADSTSSSRPSSSAFSPIFGFGEGRNSFFSSGASVGHDTSFGDEGNSEWSKLGGGEDLEERLGFGQGEAGGTPATTADFSPSPAVASATFPVGDDAAGDEGKPAKQRGSKPANLTLPPNPSSSSSSFFDSTTTENVGLGFDLPITSLTPSSSFHTAPLTPGHRSSFDGEGDLHANLERLSLFAKSLPSPLPSTAALATPSPTAFSGFGAVSVGDGEKTLVLPVSASPLAVPLLATATALPPLPPLSIPRTRNPSGENSPRQHLHEQRSFTRSSRSREASAASAISTAPSLASSLTSSSRRPSLLHLPRPQLSKSSLRGGAAESEYLSETDFLSSEGEDDLDADSSFQLLRQSANASGSQQGFLGFGEFGLPPHNPSAFADGAGFTASGRRSFAAVGADGKTRGGRGSGLWNADVPLLPGFETYGAGAGGVVGLGIDGSGEEWSGGVRLMPTMSGEVGTEMDAPEEDVVDWSSRAIERKELPVETTHLILNNCATPFEIAPLLTLTVPLLTHGLVVLDIGDCGLSEIPSAIASCCFLEELDIHGNNLATGTLPTFLGALPALRVLLADSCGLTSLPPQLSQLSRLHTLTLRDNKLRALPTWLCRLNALEALLVDGNPFHFQLHHLVRPLFVADAARPADFEYGHASKSTTATPGPSRPISPQPSFYQHRTSDSLSSSSAAAQYAFLPPLLPPTFPGSPGPASSSLVSPIESESGRSFSSPPIASPAFFRSTSATPIYQQFSSPPSLGGTAQHSQIDLGQVQVELEKARDGTRHASEPPASSGGAIGALALSAPVLSPMAMSPPISSASSVTNFSMAGVAAPNGGPEKEGKKKWAKKLMKKVSEARLRSGSTASLLRPGALDETNRTYSQPVTREEAEEATAGGIGGGRFASLGRRKKSHNTLTKPRPGLVQVGGRLPPPQQKRRSFLMLDAFSSPRPSTAHDLPSPTPQDHAAALRTVLAYLRDLYDLSPDPLTLPHVPLDSAPPSTAPSLRHAPSFERSVPSLRHSPSLGAIGMAPPSRAVSPAAIRRAQSTRRLPSTSSSSPRPNSQRLSQFYDEDEPRSSMPAGAAPGPTKLVDDPQKREAVLREIVETEQTYLRGLEELCGIYVNSASVPLGTSASGKKDTILPAAERRVVFSNIEAIRDFHRHHLLPDLLLAVQSSTSALSAANSAEIAAQIGEVFLKHASFLKIYSSFINGLDDAFARIQSWAKGESKTSGSRPGTASGFASPNLAGGTLSVSEAQASERSSLSSSQKKRIKTWLKRCRAHPSHSQISLESYLLLPLQRVPRYKMLLESLSTCTPSPYSSPSLLDPTSSFSKSSPSLSLTSSIRLEPHPALVQAVQEMDEVATVLNESKRENEGRAQLLGWQNRIQQKFKSSLVQPHRSLVRSGNLTLVRSVKRNTTQVEPLLPSLYRKPTQEDASEVSTLFQEEKEVDLIALLCTDLLVLCKAPPAAFANDPSYPVELYTVVRLKSVSSTPRPESPISLYGKHDDMLRVVVGEKAIMYLTAKSRKNAIEWLNQINLCWERLCVA